MTMIEISFCSAQCRFAMWRDHKGDYAEPEILLRNAAYKIANNIIDTIKGAKNA